MFDPSAPHIIILMIVVLLLFGSKRLPGAAKSLGQSMHIFKKSVSGLGSDDEQVNAANGGFFSPAATAATAAPPALPITQPVQDPAQTQIEELQRQVRDLQQQTAGGNAGQPGQPV
jgi:sec-independent protein translocase protein TatA